MIRPFFSRVGGKRKLIKTLLKNVPSHKVFVEAFVGAGNMLFYKEKAEESYINDVDDKVYNLYKTLKENGKDINTDFLTNTAYCNRETFNSFRSNYNVYEGAKKFEAIIYLNKLSFRGNNKSFAPVICKRGLGCKTFCKKIDKYIEFMSDVNISNIDYKDCIKPHLNNEDAFIFLDPPYSYCKDYKNYYNVNYLVSPQEIVDVLKGCKCKFMITYDDNPHIREVFRDYKIIDTTVRYSSSSGVKTDNNKEVIIMNY